MNNVFPSLCRKFPKKLFLIFGMRGAPLWPSFPSPGRAPPSGGRQAHSQQPGLAVPEPNGDNQLPLHYPQPRGAAAPNIIPA